MMRSFSEFEAVPPSGRRVARARRVGASRKSAARKRRERRVWLETLEERRVLASVWQNLPFPLDVTDDGFTSPVDALVIINELNQPTLADALGRLPASKPLQQPFYDADGDTFLAPRDALLVINQLNSAESPLRVTARLSHDTSGPTAGSTQDGLSFDPAVVGSISFAGATPTVYGRVDGGPAVLLTLGGDGLYAFAPPLATNGAADGPHTVRITALSSLGQVASAFVSFTLDTRPPEPRPVLALDASFDTAPVGDLTTQFERVTLVGTTASGATVTLLETGATAVADQTGAFAFADLPLTLGDNTFRARIFDAAGNQATGTLTIVRAPETVDVDPPDVSAALGRDTGASETDGVTSEFAIQGQATDVSGVAALNAAFDGGPSFDILAALRPDGAFDLAMDTLETAYGATLPDGPHRLTIEAIDTKGHSRQIEVSFTLDRTAPAPPTLELAAAFDSAPVGDGRTTFATVAVQGLSEPGVPVELLEAGRSVVPSATGEYQIADVALPFGARPFTVRATDLAGNVAQSQRMFTREFTGIVVAEADRRIDRLTLPLDLGPEEGARSLSFDLAATFDSQSAAATFPDAFSVYLTDPSGRTLVDRGVPGTTLFTWEEQQASEAPAAAGVTFDGSRVTIDVTRLAGIGAANLTFEFRNFDDDFGGSVTIADLRFDVDSQDAAAQPPPPRLGIATPAAIDPDYVRYGETYSTDDVAVLADNLRFDAATGVTTLDLRIENHSGVTLGRDAYVALGDLPAGARVLDASRPDGLGRPLVNLASVVPDTGLPDGATSERLTMRIAWNAPLTDRFSPTFSVRARPAVLEIFERVLNVYEFDPYRGALRGPDGVRDVGAGNAWDISSVLIEDLRAAGIRAEYAFDTVTMPVDDVVNWVGARDVAGAFAMLDAAHLDVVAVHENDDPEAPVVAFSFDHAWVWANLEFPDGPLRLIDLDPSFKRHTFQPGVENLATLVPFDDQAYLSGSQPVYVDGYYANRVAEYLAEHFPGKTLDDVPYRATIVPQHFTRLVPLSMLSFTYDGNPFTAPEIPQYDQNRVVLEFRYPGGGVFNLPPSTIIQREFNLARDARQTIVASLESQRSYIAVGDDFQYSVGATGGTRIEIVASYIYADDDDLIGVPDAVRTFDRSLGGGEVIGIAFGVGQIGPELLARRWKEANGFDSTGGAQGSRNVLRSLTALEYFHGEYEALDRIAGLTEQRRNYSKIGLGMAIGLPISTSPNYVPPHPDLPVTDVLSQRFGLFSDFLPFATPLDDETSGAVTRDKLGIYNNSDQERALWERVFNGQGFNAVRSLQLAHDRQIPIFTIDATNRVQLEPQLNLSTFVKNWIAELLNGGFQIVVPQNNTSFDDFVGVGFLTYVPGNPVPTGFLVSGGLKGSILVGPESFPPYPCPNNVPAGGGLPPGKTQMMCPSTGSLIREEVDVEIPSVGLDLVFTRRYDSSQRGDLGLGVGWRSNYSESLFRYIDDGPLYWVTDEGRTWEFLKNGNSYRTPPELDGRLFRSGDEYIYREKDGFERHFSAGGQLRRLEDRYGNALEMLYDGHQRLAEVRHANDPERWLAFQRDGAGHLTRVTDFTGRTWNYEYRVVSSAVPGESYTLLQSVTPPIGPTTPEAITRYEYFLTNYASEPLVGLLRRVVDPDGLATDYRFYPNRMLFQYEEPDGGVGTYYYDVLGAKTRFVNERGYETQYGYDGRGYVTSVREDTGDGGEATTTYVWANDEIVRETNPLGYVSTFTYDGSHNLIEYVDPAGGVTTYTYDTTYSQRTSETDPLGRPTTFQLDAFGSVVRETDPLGAVTTHTYDQHGQRLTTVDPLGNLTPEEGDYTTRFAYDATGQVISIADDPPTYDTFYLDARGNVLQHDDANDRSTIYTYDARDRRTSKTDAAGGVERYYYDVLDRLVAQTDPAGRTTSYRYDRENSTITTIYPDGSRTIERYDPLDNLVVYVDARSNVTRYAYDGLNRRTQTTFADGSTERFRYDLGGRMIRRTDARGASTRLTYDPLDRLTAVIDPLGGVNTMTYDAVGNLTEETDRRGEPTRYVYDAGDRLVESIDPLQNSTTAAYDANGNVVSVTDAAGFTTTMQYDVLDRLVRSIDPLNGETQFAYDRVGNTIAVTDPAGHVNQLAYDALDRLVATIDPLGNVSTLRYDAVGNLVGARDPLGRESTFAYDPLDRLLRTVDPTGAVTSREYDLSGNLIAQSDERGFRTEFDYDVLDRQVARIDARGGVLLHEYDANGNRIATTDELGRITTAEYDALDRRTRSIDALGGVTTYAYDAEGNVIGRTDELGRASAWVYDALGRVVQYVDPLAGTSATQYDAVGNVVAQIDPLGRVTQLSYDGLRRLVASTDPAGSVSRWNYDAAGNVTSTVDKLGRITTYAYDARDRRLQTTDAEDGVWEFEYDAVGNQVRVVNPRGFATTSTYDALNRVVATTDASGAERGWRYDAAGHVIALVDPLARETTFEYDELGRAVATEDPLGGRRTYEYDAVGNVTTEIDEAGRMTRHVYDALNRQIESRDPLHQVVHFQYDAVGNVTAVTDRLGRTTHYAFDALDRLAHSTDALGGVVRYAYDAVGNLKRVEDELGRTTHYRYDVRNQLVSSTDPLGNETQFAYDRVGNRTATTDALGRTTSTEYDRLDRPVRRIDALGGVVVWHYDANGNLVSTTDPLGRTTSYAFDQVDRQVRAIDPAGHATELQFDAVGDLVAETDALGHVTRHTYDALHREVETLDALGARTTYAYDVVGNLTSVTDASNNTTAYEYDDLDRLVRDTDPRGAARRYVYDAEGNVVESLDRDDRSVRYTYDALDRQIREDWLDAGGAPLHTITATYDAAGQMLTASDVDSTYAFAYDLAGRRTSDSNAGTPGAPTIVFTYQYDAVGRRIGRDETIGGTAGAVNRYVYDPLDRLTQVTQAGAGIAPKRVDFSYDAAGQLVGESRYADLAGANSVATTARNFDATGRVTSIVHAHGAVPLATYSFAYDAAQRLAHTTGPDGATDYAYDALGQLLNADHAGQDDESFEYDATGNRTGGGYVTDVGDRLLSDGTYDYAYDGEGNRVRRTEIATGAVTEYSWDHRNRLTSVVTRASVGGPETSRADYTYDLFDRRIAKSVDTDGVGPAQAVTTRFVLDGPQIALQTDGAGQPTHRYLFADGIDQILADENALGEVLWPLSDHQGTVRDLVDSTGAVVNHVSYDSFGRVTAETDAAVDHLFGYTGRERDEETGLLYYRARYYDPAVGRFLSQDPLGFASGDANLYRYVGNSPTNFVDPTGLFEVDSTGSLIVDQPALPLGNIPPPTYLQNNVLSGGVTKTGNLSEGVSKTAARSAGTPARQKKRLKCTKCAAKRRARPKPQPINHGSGPIRTATPQASPTSPLSGGVNGSGGGAGPAPPLRGIALSELLRDEAPRPFAVDQSIRTVLSGKISSNDEAMRHELLDEVARSNTPRARELHKLEAQLNQYRTTDDYLNDAPFLPTTKARAEKFIYDTKLGEVINFVQLLGDLRGVVSATSHLVELAARIPQLEKSFAKLSTRLLGHVESHASYGASHINPTAQIWDADPSMDRYLRKLLHEGNPGYAYYDEMLTGFQQSHQNFMAKGDLKSAEFLERSIFNAREMRRQFELNCLSTTEIQIRRINRMELEWKVQPTGSQRGAPPLNLSPGGGNPGAETFFKFRSLAPRLGGTYQPPMSYAEVFGRGGIAEQMRPHSAIPLNHCVSGQGAHAVVLYKSPRGTLFIIDGQSNSAFSVTGATGSRYLHSATFFEAITFPAP